MFVSSSMFEYKFWLQGKKNLPDITINTHAGRKKCSICIELNNQQGPNYFLLTFILQKRQGIIW